VSFTVPGPTTGAWNIVNTDGVALRFCIGSGANYKTAVLDAWQAVFALAPMTQANMLSAINQNFVLTDVQFEVGTVATPFERRAYAQELVLCQRYYENNMPSGSAPGDNV